MNSSNWAAWITAIGTAAGAVGVLIVAVLKNYFVTRAELKEALQGVDGRTDARHMENQKRLSKQDEELKEIRDTANDVKNTLSRLEGQLSGRYPRIGG